MKDERVYLGHIRDAVNDIEEYASAGRDAFMAERMRQDAVIRKLEIMVRSLCSSVDRPLLRPGRSSYGTYGCAIVRAAHGDSRVGAPGELVSVHRERLQTRVVQTTSRP